MRLLPMQAGDTIVEVLIAVAVISLVLTGAYSVTNRNTLTTQDTQERSQAIELLQSQVEFLRQSGSLPSGSTCFNSVGAGVSGDQCLVSADGSSPGAGPNYFISIAGDPTTKYTLTITWDSLLHSSSGCQSTAAPVDCNTVNLYYRP